MSPEIPSEDDFLKISSPRDFVEEAVKDGLVKDGDTRSTHERTYVPVSQRGAPAPGEPVKAPTRNTSWASDRAWVDVQKICLGLTVLDCQVTEWCEENDKHLAILYSKGPKFHDLWEELEIDTVGAARENARSLRFL